MNNDQLIGDPANVKFMRTCYATYFLKTYLANMQKKFKI